MNQASKSTNLFNNISLSNQLKLFFAKSSIIDYYKYVQELLSILLDKDKEVSTIFLHEFVPSILQLLYAIRFAPAEVVTSLRISGKVKGNMRTITSHFLNAAEFSRPGLYLKSMFEQDFIYDIIGWLQIGLQTGSRLDVSTQEACRCYETLNKVIEASWVLHHCDDERNNSCNAGKLLKRAGPFRLDKALRANPFLIVERVFNYISFDEVKYHINTWFNSISNYKQRGKGRAGSTYHLFEQLNYLFDAALLISYNKLTCPPLIVSEEDNNSSFASWLIEVHRASLSNASKIKGLLYLSYLEQDYWQKPLSYIHDCITYKSFKRLKSGLQYWMIIFLNDDLEIQEGNPGFAYSMYLEIMKLIEAFYLIALDEFKNEVL